MKYNKRDYKNTAIHCPTKELAEKVRVICGLEDSYSNGYWYNYEENFCINPNDGFANTNWYENEGYTIIPAEEFIKKHTESEIIDNYEIF